MPVPSSRTFWWRGWLVALALLSPVSAFASAVSPDVYWGGLLVPEVEERDDLGLHFLAFTRFGKETLPDGSAYTFNPYNDWNHTQGFNILSYSQTRSMERVFGPNGNEPLLDSPIWITKSYQIGLVGDAITEFLQNDVVHWASWRKSELLRVPRDTSDTFDHTSHGRSSNTPIVQYGRSYSVRFEYLRRQEDRTERVPTSFFVGAGFTAGTLNQDLYVHAGSMPTLRRFDFPSPRSDVRLRGAGFGFVVRTGLLYPGYFFRDVTSGYVSAQAAASLDIAIAHYPVEVTIAGTTLTGFFVAGRDSVQRAAAEEVGNGVDGHYQSKRALTERFLTFRVRIGRFDFETFNDSWGGKDKGPSFGARMEFNLMKPPLGQVRSEAWEYAGEPRPPEPAGEPK
jgi:hypothetical protein